MSNSLLSSRGLCAAAVIAALGAASTANAQLPFPKLSLAGGVSHYNLSGSSGSTAIGAVRVDIPVVLVLLEGSLAAFRPTEAGDTHTYVIPEAQLQWQFFPAIVRPYIGVGGGWIKSLGSSTTSRSDVTLSASAGVRVSVPIIGFGVRAEARARSIGSGFHEHATEFTLGASW
jgi:hypothetical protein